jgi:hypothetical protein
MEGGGNTLPSNAQQVRAQVVNRGLLAQVSCELPVVVNVLPQACANAYLAVQVRCVDQSAPLQSDLQRCA